MTRYELVERIGSGGMAEIFRGSAIAAGGFEKPVAIKRILPHLCQDKRFVELLIAEAHILSLLRHRTIVQIFDVGVGPDGQYFLVMEFVDGGDLGRIREGLEEEKKTLPTDLGLYIGSEVCEALEQAHTAAGPDGQPMRLVHRDVSPSNILLSRSGEVKLTDFGIAKRPEDVTGHGTVRGKFAYISPEQAFNGHVDARSDVFSVGIVLYELLLGRRLFSKLPDFEALRAVRNGEITRPIEVAPHIDPRLDQLLCTALAASPDNRFSSAGELGRALRELRYSLPASDVDPAQELASLVERYMKPFGERKPAPKKPDEGFSLTIDLPADLDAQQSYFDARQIVSNFEEEVTRSISLDDEELLRRYRGDDDVTSEGDEGSEETVVGNIHAMRRRTDKPAGKRGSGGDSDERPTNMMRAPAGPAIEVADRDMADYAERQRAAAGAGDDDSLDLPTIDQSLVPELAPGHKSGNGEGAPAGADAGTGGPLPATLKGGVSPVPKLANVPGNVPSNVSANGGQSMSPGGGQQRAKTAAVAAYPPAYSPEAVEAEAIRRRKRMIIGVVIGGLVLIGLIVLALAVDDGEAAATDEVTVDAGALDAGAVDAGAVDAAPPVDAAPAKKAVKPKKKRKKTRKKRRKKRPTRKKKTTTKKKTTRKK